MKNITKDQFVSLLKDAGVTEDQMRALHHGFERRFPDQHEAFLEHLGLSEDRIREIRQRAAQ